jgi:hypothetical protein
VGEPKPEKLLERGRRTGTFGWKFARGIAPIFEPSTELGPSLFLSRDGDSTADASGLDVRGALLTGNGGTGDGDLGVDAAGIDPGGGTVAGGGSMLKLIGTGPCELARSTTNLP